MYRPRAFAVDDRAVLCDAIRAYPFATIGVANDGVVQFAYAPVVLDSEGVRFHLAKPNPVTSLAGGRPVVLSFRGPDSYVSPDWYVTDGLVPTWNYIAVEVRGVARKLSRDELRVLLDDLSAQQERALLPKTPWTMEKVPAQRAEAMLNGIEGFAVPFETLLGKFKLSQDRSSDDAGNVIAALEARGDAASLAVAKVMRRART